jgi:hypothetical protein
MEMALCREASLEVVHLRDQATNAIETVAILGTSSTESGAREWQQIVARTDTSHFILYTYPAVHGAEPRVKRAAHTKAQAPTTPATLPTPVTHRPSLATLLSTPTPTAAPAHAHHR